MSRGVEDPGLILARLNYEFLIEYCLELWHGVLPMCHASNTRGGPPYICVPVLFVQLRVHTKAQMDLPLAGETLDPWKQLTSTSIHWMGALLMSVITLGRQESGIKKIQTY